MIRIITSSQPFGYGPSSKLVTIAKMIKQEYRENVKVDFMGDDIALTYVTQNGFSFNNIISYKGEYPDPDHYDLVISVMNPYMAIWGWLNRKKVVFIDSLYWFYTWDISNFTKIEKIIEELCSVEKLAEAWSLIKNIDFHYLQYIAHRLATKSWTQSYMGENENTSPIFRDMIDKVEVGAIIDLSYRQKHQKKDTILISLCGLLSPLNRPRDAIRYCQMIIGLFDDFIRSLPNDINVVLTTSPEIVSHVRSSIDRLQIVALNNSELLKILNKTLVVFAPAGITTIYECTAYGVPIVFLPEQHDGHHLNYQRIIGLNPKANKKIFPELLINTRTKRQKNNNPDGEIKEIKTLIKKIHAGIMGDVVLDIKETLEKLKTTILVNENRIRLADEQYQVLFKNTSCFQKHSLKKQIRDVLSQDEPPRVVRKFNVGIISSAVIQTDKQLVNRARELGEMLGLAGFNVSTGASIGYPEIIGIAARKKSARVTGYSPAANSYLHQLTEDNSSIKHFDKIYYCETGFTARSLDFLQSVDAVIMLAGRIGTLSEFTIAFEERIPIFVYKGFGGISDHIETILKLSEKSGRTHVGLVFDNKEMVESLKHYLFKKYYL